MNLPRQHVLLVDDDRDTRETLAEILIGGGYAVTLAANGLEALDLLPEIERPCLILLDMKMPVVDGYEFMGRLPLRFRDIPIVVMSASGNLPRGVTVLPKPFSIEELHAHVDLHCKGGAALASAGHA